MAYLTIKQLSEKYNIHRNVIYRLIRGGMPYKKEYVKFENIKRGKDLLTYPAKKVILIDEEDWLEIPTFIRKKYKRGNRKVKSILKGGRS